MKRFTFLHALLALNSAMNVQAQDRPTHGATAQSPSEISVDVPALIDSHMREVWQKHGKTPSPPANDLEFLRRASLDIVGRTPTLAEIRAYEALPQDERRGATCDKLVSSPEFAEYMALQWADLITQKESPFQLENETDADRQFFRKWLKPKFASNSGWDKVTTEILTSSAYESNSPAQNMFMNTRGDFQRDKRFGDYSMEPATNLTSRLFLGVQMECAQCHNHFFDNRLTQQRYWELNAFFRETPSGEKVSDHLYYRDTAGTSYTASPRFLDGTRPDLTKYPSRRHALAASLLQSEAFAEAMVNRYWGMMFGVGLNDSEQLDDLSAQNPVAYPELMQMLAREIRRAEFKPRELVRWICKSKPYSLSSVRNPGQIDEESKFSFARSRPMNDYQLLRSLPKVLSFDPGRISEENLGKELLTHMELRDGNAVSVANGVHLKNVAMMKSPDLNSAIQAWAKRVGIEDKSNAIETAYLQILGRRVTAQEKASVMEKIQSTADLADLGWALLHSSSFGVNY